MLPLFTITFIINIISIILNNNAILIIIEMLLKKNIKIFDYTALQLNNTVCSLQHIITGLNSLGAGFISSLCYDEVYQFSNNLDI